MNKLMRILLGTVAFVPSVFGQFDTAAVLGTIRDPSGAVIPDSKVTLENTRTGIAETKQTDDAGNYDFLNVRIGSYRVKAEPPDSRPPWPTSSPSRWSAPEGGSDAGRRRHHPEPSRSTTPRRRSKPIRATAARWSSRDTIVNLPLNGRAYADLALLTPGVRKSALIDQSSSNFRDSSFNVNGLRSSLNNFKVDGVDNNAYGTSNQGYSNQAIQLNPDAVAEFKVQTNNFSAEYGRAGGAIVNVSVRSGTNEFHGAAWEFLRNTKLNAVGFFKPALGKPVFQQNQFGAAFGGPIRKNKTFFFADYEGTAARDAVAGLPQHPHHGPAQGHLRRPRQEPVHRRGLLRTA